MKNLPLLLLTFITFFAGNAWASLCDNSTLEILNLTNQEIAVASIQPQKNTNIIPTQGTISPRGSLLLSVQSGRGSRGDATGEIVLVRKEPVEENIHLNYQFIQKKNIFTFGDPSSCYASLNITGIPDSAYYLFAGESARKGQTRASFILIE